MDNNAPKLNTGSKGTFPVSQNTPAQEVSAPTIAPNPLDTLNPVQTPQSNEQAEQAQSSQSPPTSNTDTYIRLETKNSDNQVSGVLELDLVSFREKGEEYRYFKVYTVGIGEDNNQTDTLISISNESDFNRFKKFVSNLNWND